MDDDPTLTLEHTTRIIVAYLQFNQIPPDQLPVLITVVGNTLFELFRHAEKTEGQPAEMRLEVPFGGNVIDLEQARLALQPVPPRRKSRPRKRKGGRE